MCLVITVPASQHLGPLRKASRSGSLGQHSPVLWEAAAGWPSEPRLPASPRNPYPLALVGAAEDHLDDDRVIGVQVPSWLDVEIGQRGDQPLSLRSFPRRSGRSIR
jgi:hypothetical protein